MVTSILHMHMHIYNKDKVTKKLKRNKGRCETIWGTEGTKSMGSEYKTGKWFNTNKAIHI